MSNQPGIGWSLLLVAIIMALLMMLGRAAGRLHDECRAAGYTRWDLFADTGATNRALARSAATAPSMRSGKHIGVQAGESAHIFAMTASSTTPRTMRRAATMKIRVTLKDPDSMHDCVEEAVRADIEANTQGLSKKEQEYLLDERAEPIQSEIAHRWMPYGEYLSVEFDTDTWTATVAPAKDFK